MKLITCFACAAMAAPMVAMATEACGASELESVASSSLPRDGNSLLQLMQHKSEEVRLATFEKQKMYAEQLNRLIDSYNHAMGDSSHVQRWLQKQNATKKKILYIGIMSSPKNRARRDKARTAFLNELKQKYSDGRIVAEFIMGHTPFTGAEQGTRATVEQLELEKQLSEEAAANKDIRRIVFPEKYENLPDKVFDLLQYSTEQGYSFLMKLDDDMVINADALETFLASQKPSDCLYAGTIYWKTEAYTSQRGADNKFAPYFGGPCYLMSSALVNKIVEQGTHVAEFVSYGSSSEDVDVGRWVQWTSKLGHNVTYMELSNDIVKSPQ